MIKSKIIYIICTIIHTILRFFGFCSTSCNEDIEQKNEEDSTTNSDGDVKKGG